MKVKERIVWISIVCGLLIVSLFGIFVNEVDAGSIRSRLPYLQKFINAMSIVKREFVEEESIDDKSMIEGAIKGMMESLDDPYSVYLDSEYFEEINTTSKGNFGGVGMVISEKDNFIVVISPIEGTPAYRKGMKAGDLLISVDGNSLQGVSVTDAANMLRGTPGTTVKVEYIRHDVTYEVEIRRAIIDIPTVKAEIINDKYGYLRITQFGGTTDKYVEEKLNEFKENNVQGIIVDLRSNPGGLLHEVITITDFFVDDGVIVSTKGRGFDDNSVQYATKMNTIVSQDIPLIVLIDGGSASASEIYAGAIKDLGRGILLGEKSFGKGSVQKIYDLGNNSGLKITTAKYYTPSGVSIHGIGIEPDIEIKEPELTDDEKEILRRLLKDKVIEEKIAKNTDPTDSEIDTMADEIYNNGYPLNKRYLRKMLLNEAELDDNKKTLVDLTYDLQLKKAVQILDNGDLIYKDGKYSIKAAQ